MEMITKMLKAILIIQSEIVCVFSSVQSDIIVFPELATSGYFFTDSLSLAPHAMEWNKHKDLLEIQNRASTEKRIIVLGFPELTHEGIYNSAGIFMPKAQESKVYRKTHLFYKEKYCFLHNIFHKKNSIII